MTSFDREEELFFDYSIKDKEFVFTLIKRLEDDGYIMPKWVKNNVYKLSLYNLPNEEFTYSTNI